jgi:hypothetical protein
MRLPLPLGTFALIISLSGAAAAGPAVGGVSRLTGPATGEIEGKKEALGNASTIFLDITVRTPVATIGVRGTDFWTGPIDGQFGVLIMEGEVVVSNPAGEAILDAPGEGTNIAGADSAPGPVTQWPQEKVDRALSAVAF